MAAWWWSWLLAAVGLVGLWLAGSKHRAGWAVGVAAQVLWITYALVSAQYGFLASAAAYGFVYARNWWRWRTAREGLNVRTGAPPPTLPGGGRPTA